MGSEDLTKIGNIWNSNNIEFTFSVSQKLMRYTDETYWEYIRIAVDINLWKLTRTNFILDLVNINACAKCGQIRPICSQDIERKQNSDINQGP